MSLFMHTAGKKKGGFCSSSWAIEKTFLKNRKKHLDLLAEEGGGGEESRK